MGGRFVFPDHLFVAGYLFSPIAIAKEHIAIRQEPAVLRRLRGKFPFNRTIHSDDGDLVAFVIAAKETMANGRLGFGRLDADSNECKAKSGNGSLRKGAPGQER